MTNGPTHVLKFRIGLDGEYQEITDMFKNEDGSFSGKQEGTGVAYRAFINERKRTDNDPDFNLKVKENAEEKFQLVTGLYSNKTKTGKPYLGGKEKDGDTRYYIFEKVEVKNAAPATGSKAKYTPKSK